MSIERFERHASCTADGFIQWTRGEQGNRQILDRASKQLWIREIFFRYEFS